VKFVSAASGADANFRWFWF